MEPGTCTKPVVIAPLPPLKTPGSLKIRFCYLVTSSRPGRETTDFAQLLPTNSIFPIESNKSHLPPSASSIGCLPIRMTDAPPQLQQIHQSSGFSVPTLQSSMDNNTTNGNVQSAKDTIYSSQVCLNPTRSYEMLANHCPLQYPKSSRDLQSIY